METGWGGREEEEEGRVTECEIENPGRDEMERPGMGR